MNGFTKEKAISYIIKHNKSIFLVLSVLVSLFYMLLTYRNTLPISEGWYSVYAKSINSGLSPYKDFELLFTPIYTYVITLITKVFGYDIVTLRLFGVIVFVSISALFYLIFNKMFSPLISMISSLTSVFFLQSESVFIAYDYIRIFDLFVYLSAFMLFMIIWLFKEGRKRKIYLYSLLCGFFSGLSFLTRQSSGAIFVLFIIMSILCLSIIFRSKKYLRILVIYILSVSLPIVFQAGFLLLNGSLDAFIQSTFSNALAAKGGMATVLFDWVIRLVPSILQLKCQIFCLLLTLIIAYLIKSFKVINDSDERFNSIIGIAFAAITSTGIALTLISLYVSYYLNKLIILDNMPITIYVVIIVLFVISLIFLIKKIRRHEDLTWLVSFIVLQGVVLTLGFGAGTSAGLSIGETCLALGIISALLFKLVGDAYRQRIKLFLILLCGLMIGVFVSHKNIIPYTWWGMYEYNTDTMTQEIDNVPYLKGLKVSSSTEALYEGTYSLYQEYLSEEDLLFTFPHNPIFYLIADRKPFTYSYVQWFDVSSDAALEQDMQTIQEKKPKVLSIMFIKEWVMAGHEHLFRNDEASKQRQMQEFLQQFIQDNGYILVQEFSIDNVNKLCNYVRNP